MYFGGVHVFMCVRACVYVSGVGHILCPAASARFVCLFRMYLCAYIHVHVCICMCLFVHLCMCMCMCVYAHVFMLMCVCVYVHVFMCMCICAG